jgi:hypothetical protein
MEVESKQDRRLQCWESVFDRGVIEGLCPVCQCSTIRYKSTTGTTFQKLHIIPTAHGGRNDASNLLPGCGCNQNMASYNLVDWMGTRGNKKALLRPLFLRKYKSLVAPYHRSITNRLQLVDWIREEYQPALLHLYEDWLILLDEELLSIQYDGWHEMPIGTPTPQKIEKVSPYFSRKHQQPF